MENDDEDDGYSAGMTIPILQVRILRTQHHTASKWWQVPLLPKGMLFQCYPTPSSTPCPLLHRGEMSPQDTLGFGTRNREGSADTSALDMEINKEQ